MTSIFSSFLGGGGADRGNGDNHIGGDVARNSSSSTRAAAAQHQQLPQDPAQRQKDLSQQLLMLVARIEGSSSLEQRREAASELAAAVGDKPAWDSDSICAAFSSHHVASLRSVVRDNSEEFDIVASVLDILLAASALPSGATGWTEIAQGEHSSSKKFSSSSNNNNGGSGKNGGRTREQQRSHAIELVSVLTDETPFLLGLLSARQNNQASAASSAATTLDNSTTEKVPFWVQYNVLQLLARIHAVDNAVFGRHLLQHEDGVQLLLGILADNSNNGALRDECLALLGDLTLISSNHELQTILSFHGCFDTLFAVIKEEGGIASGSVVVRECITVMHNMLRTNHAAQRVFRENGNVQQLAALLNTDVFVGASPLRGAARDAAAQAAAANVPRSAAETYATVGALVSALLRSADSNGEGSEIRAACVSAQLPQALVRAALESLPVGEGSYEAEEMQLLSTLSLLVQKNPAAIDAVVSAEVRQFGTYVDATWLLMRMALSDGEPARANVAATLLTSAISVGGEPVATKLLDGLEKKPSAPQQLPGASPPMKSGYVLAALTMSSKPPTPTTWYIAGHILASLIMASPGSAAAIAISPWSVGGAAAAAAAAAATDSSSSSFFVAYVARTKRMIESRQTDIATNMAALFPILAWLRVCPHITVPLFVSDPTLPMFFADWAAACRDGQHTPFMSAAILALSILMYPPADQQQQLGVSQQDLSDLIINNVTLPRLQKTRDAVVDSDEWHRATRNPALASMPTVLVYDQRMCTILTEVAGAMLQPQQQQQQQQPEPATAAVDENPTATAATATAAVDHHSGSNSTTAAAEEDAYHHHHHGDGAATTTTQEDPFSADSADPFAAVAQDEHGAHASEFDQQQQQQHEPKSDDSFVGQVLQPPTDSIHGADEQEPVVETNSRRFSPSQGSSFVPAAVSKPQEEHHHQQQQQQPQHAHQFIQQQDPAVLEQLAEAQRRCAELEQRLAESDRDNQRLQHEAAAARADSDAEIDRLQRAKEELSAQFQQAYQLLKTRDDALESAERKMKLTEMALADMTRDRNELMLLVAEMEAELEGACVDAEITPIARMTGGGSMQRDDDDDDQPQPLSQLHHNEHDDQVPAQSHVNAYLDAQHDHHEQHQQQQQPDDHPYYHQQQQQAAPFVPPMPQTYQQDKQYSAEEDPFSSGGAANADADDVFAGAGQPPPPIAAGDDPFALPRAQENATPPIL